MSLFVTKTLLAMLFVVAGLTAALSMLTLMGKAERKMGVMALRNTHRVAGYAFAVLLVVLAILGLHYLSAASDSLSLRGVLHWSAAALLVFVFALKLAVVRWFKQFIKFAPVMGMIVITLALVVVTLSAVFFVVTGGFGGSGNVVSTAEVESRADTEQNQAVEPEAADPGLEVVAGEPSDAVKPTEPGKPDDTETPPPEPVGSIAGADPVREADTAAGQQVFARSCAGCHHSDSAGRKIGPGLAGLFEREAIASSGLPVTPENVREQILSPAGGMPAFKGLLSEEKLDDLIAFMQML
jgi:cytochrome c2